MGLFSGFFLIWVSRLSKTEDDNFFFFFLQRKSVVRVQAESVDFELKQMRDMAAARKRWEALVHFNFTQLFVFFVF